MGEPGGSPTLAVRVLIVGARGTLGRALVRAFADADVLARDLPEIDITNPDAVRERVASARPHLLINAAAYTAVDRAEAEEDIANAVNGTAVGTLAAAAAMIGATFVHYSTDYVFDGAAPDGYAEGAHPHPINAYGRSKLLGERALAMVAAANPEWPWYCIRTSRLFGGSAVSVHAKRSFVDAMLAQRALRDRIDVVDAEVASPTYVSDLARATRAMVDERLPRGTYHRTNDGSCTWYAFAREIFRITGWTGTVAPVPPSAYARPAPRPACSVLRTTKLPPLRRWEQALAECLSGR